MMVMMSEGQWVDLLVETLVYQMVDKQVVLTVDELVGQMVAHWVE